ncbi:hypothetical protein MMC17_006776 [Xylographa soralifera]|nr:hypothetical protein [Xylographa soralifera]
MVRFRSKSTKLFRDSGPSTKVVLKLLYVPRTPLGTFSKFPFEVRCGIWKYMLERPVNLSILQTSKQLHEEITTEIYKNQILEIDIDTNEGIRFKKATFARCDPLAEFKIRILGMNFEPLEDADWAKFQHILIQIHPVEMDDPGQMLVVRNNVVSLMMKMQKAPRIQSVRVDILGEPEEWSKLSDTGDEFIKSDSIHNTRNDIEHLLKPFMLLRSIEIASLQPDGWHDGSARPMYGPGVNNVGDQYKLAYNIEQAMMRKIAFEEDESDAAILEEHRIMTIELDMALDRLPGYTARMLRRERFKTWMSYEPEMHRLLHQIYPNLSKNYQNGAIRALRFRTEAWVYFRTLVNTGPNECWDETWDKAFPNGIGRSQSGTPIRRIWERRITSKADIVAKGVYEYLKATNRFEDGRTKKRMRQSE